MKTYLPPILAVMLLPAFIALTACSQTPDKAAPKASTEASSTRCIPEGCRTGPLEDIREAIERGIEKETYSYAV